MTTGEADAGKEPEWDYDTGWWLDSVAISADGEYIAAGSHYDDETVYLFNKDSSIPLWSYETETGQSVYTVAISADGEYIAAGAFDDRVYLFDADSGDGGGGDDDGGGIPAPSLAAAVAAVAVIALRRRR